MTENQKPSSGRPPADPRPPVVFNMYNGQNRAGERHEYGVENNVTERYKGVGGVEQLEQDIVAAAELGFRRMMLHTVMGGGPGHFITGNGRFSIPALKWNALANMVGEVVDAYPDIEIGPHFACLYTMNLASPLGPNSAGDDACYDKFPSLVGESTWEREFWEATRDAWRDIGCTWMSGDHWMNHRTVDRAVEVTHEEWAKRRFRIVNESIPVGPEKHHKAAELVDCWILSQTMVQRKALAGPDYQFTGIGVGSLQPVPEHVRGHWYTYHWINRWPLIPGATNDAEAMAELMKLGWVVMHHDAERLDEACGLAGIDVETGLPVPQKPKPKPIEPSPRSPRDEPDTDDAAKIRGDPAPWPAGVMRSSKQIGLTLDRPSEAQRVFSQLTPEQRNKAFDHLLLEGNVYIDEEGVVIDPARVEKPRTAGNDPVIRRQLLRDAIRRTREELDEVEGLIEEADDPDDEK